MRIPYHFRYHRPMNTSSRKDAAQDFLRLVTQGKIHEAFETHVGPEFRHHNAYSRSDAASLRKGMEENHALFPHKILDVRHVVGEGDLVVVHSRMRLAEDKPEMSLVHVFRFSGERIAELWDTAQPVPQDMANELGMF